MSAALTKFQELLALSKVMGELHGSVGIKDKTLAEFVLSMARKAPNVDDFGKDLQANGADFDQDLVNTIFAVVTRIFPAQRPKTAKLASIFNRSSPLIEECKELLHPSSSTEQPVEANIEMYDAEQHHRMKDALKKSYPGLAMPNKLVKDEDEIELDMDELDDALRAKPKSPRMLMKARSRSRSQSSSNSRRRRRRSYTPEHHRNSRRHHQRYSSASESSEERRRRRRRSRSPREERRRRSSSESSRGRQRREKLSLEQQMHKLLKIGKIYRGTVQKVIDFGLFIRIEVG